MATSGTETKLYMIYDLDNGKTASISLAAPKDDLTGAQVKAVMDEAVANKVIMVGTALVSAVKDAYVQTISKTDLDVTATA